MLLGAWERVSGLCSAMMSSACGQGEQGSSFVSALLSPISIFGNVFFHTDSAKSLFSFRSWLFLASYGNN